MILENLRPTYFIRHNWEHADMQQVIRHLFNSNSIGVHFNEVNHPKDPFTPENYEEKSGRTCIQYLNDCSEKSSLIVASYRNHDRILIGLSETGSKQAEILNGSQIKFLQLKHVKSVSIQEFPLPFLIAPPFATFVKWHMGRLAVNSFYYGHSPNPKVELMSPWHLEILAEEWLRQKKYLYRKLFKTGKAMKDMDIVGLSHEGKYILAQVKYSCTDETVKAFLVKIDSLENTIGFFFTTESKLKDKRVILFKDMFIDFELEENYLKMLAFGHI